MTINSIHDEVRLQINALRRDIDQARVSALEKKAAKQVLEEAQNFYHPDYFPIIQIKEHAGRLRIYIWGYTKQLMFTPQDNSYFQVSYPYLAKLTTAREVLQFVEDNS